VPIKACAENSGKSKKGLGDELFKYIVNYIEEKPHVSFSKASLEPFRDIVAYIEKNLIYLSVWNSHT
jgi:hypothetical protein